MANSLATIQSIWFMVLYYVFFLAIVVIAAGICGYGFEHGRALYKRWHHAPPPNPES